MRENLPVTIPFVLGAAAIAGLVAAQLEPIFGWVAAGLVLIKLGTIFWASPQTTGAYSKGASGERKTGKVLEKVADYVALHDRRIPGSRANIDHIVVGPGGVFVIETKNYTGKLRVQQGELRVSGRDRTSIIDQARREAEAVQKVLEKQVAEPVDVKPIICMHGAELPLAPTQLHGVPVVGGAGLRKILRTSPSRLSRDEIARIHDLLDGTLKAA